jgi:multiple sugar transport system ATP-binding protein
MSVFENMSFALKLRKTPRDVIDQKVKKAAKILGIEQLLDRKPKTLSGGQRQRVALGRAIVRDPKCFLFDEPLSNLDAKLRAELRRELKLLHQNLGSTMVYVTHDQAEAMTLATRIVVMQGGRIQQIGTPAEVYERPANRFVAGFLGSPSMNFVEGHVKQGRFSAGLLALDCTAPCGAVTLAVRPEDIHLAENGALHAKVTLVEPMGNHQVVWLDCGGHQLSCIVHDPQPLASGQAVRFDIDAARVSLFDPVSGQRL